MMTCVFLGPSLPLAEARGLCETRYLPPAARGDVYRAGLAGARAIGLIDGRFDGVPAVCHKEILWALSRGIHVFGGASMGALRAAELAAFGMRGVGRVFAAYRDGELEDDDEVAVLHAPAEGRFEALSEALVNVRATLGRAAAEGLLAAAEADAVLSFAKSLHFPQRTWEGMLAPGAGHGVGAEALNAVRGWLPGGRVDRKREDARALLRELQAFVASEPPPFEASFHFEHTEAWERLRTLVPRWSRASDVEGRSVDDVLDELRLDPAAFREARTAALLRVLARREARRAGVAPGGEELRAAAHRLRRRAGLVSRRELEEWLAANDLDGPGLDGFLRDEALLAGAAVQVDPELTAALLDHLRAAGEYPRLAARARDKRARLAAAPGDEADGAPHLDRLRLLSWYFAERLREPLPADPASYARELGFRDVDAFLRALARERRYQGGSSEAAGYALDADARADGRKRKSGKAPCR